MIVRSSLVPRENTLINPILEVVQDRLSIGVLPFLTLPEEDHGSPRPTQAFVSCCRHDINVRKRRRMRPTSDQTGYVCHVAEEERANLVGDLPEMRVVHVPRVR